MSVLYYSLKFTKLCKYDLSFVSNPRDEISHFLMGVFKRHCRKCPSAMLHDNMNITHLMVHSKQVEECTLKRMNRDAKRAKSYESGSLKEILEIQDKPRFKKRFYKQGSFQISQGS